MLVINPENRQFNLYTADTGESIVYQSIPILLISSTHIKTTENSNIVFMDGLYFATNLPLTEKERSGFIHAIGNIEFEKQLLILKKNSAGTRHAIQKMTADFLKNMQALILKGYSKIRSYADEAHQNSPAIIAGYLLGVEYEEINNPDTTIDIKKLSYISVTEQTQINPTAFDLLLVKIGKLIQFSIIPLDDQICMLIKSEQIEFLLIADLHELIKSSASSITWYGLSYKPNKARKASRKTELLPYYYESLWEYFLKLTIPGWNWYFPNNPKTQMWKMPSFWRPAELKVPARDCSYIN